MARNGSTNPFKTARICSSPRSFASRDPCVAPVSAQANGARSANVKSVEYQLCMAHQLWNMIYKLSGWFCLNGLGSAWGKTALCATLRISLHELRWYLGMESRRDHTVSEKITPLFGPWWKVLLSTKPQNVARHVYAKEIRQVQAVMKGRTLLGCNNFGTNAIWACFGDPGDATPDNVGKEAKAAARRRTAVARAAAADGGSVEGGKQPERPPPPLESPLPPASAAASASSATPGSGTSIAGKTRAARKRVPPTDVGVQAGPGLASPTVSLCFEGLGASIEIDLREVQERKRQRVQYIAYLREEQEKREALPHNESSGNRGIKAYTTKEGLLDDSSLRNGSDRPMKMLEHCPAYFKPALKSKMTGNFRAEMRRSETMLARRLQIPVALPTIIIPKVIFLRVFFLRIFFQKKLTYEI